MIENVQKNTTNEGKGKLAENLNKDHKNRKIVVIRTDLAAMSDVQALAKAELEQLRKDILNNRGRITDDASRYHLDDIVSRIDGMKEGRF